MSDEINKPTRDRWSSKLGFLMASVGFAVGFGNVWRFPSLAFEYGGGAFFIPYLLALLFIGIPLVILEVTLGQYVQSGDVGVFGSIHKRLRGIGLGSIVCAWVLVTYYVPLIAWVCNAFVDTFIGEHWDSDTTGNEAYAYFLNDIVGGGTVGEDGRPTRIVPANVGYIAFVWLVVALCLAFGIKVTGRIAYFTMGLPLVLLFVFLGRAVSLPGSSDGINAYIGVWDMSVLVTQPECWSRAVSQIFFSVGVGFGVLTAFGSYNERDAPAFNLSITIAICNSLFSFISGFAVFSALGYLAHLEGEAVEDVAVSGPSLLFGAYPVVFSTLPGGIHWVRLIFFDLFLLGIDTAFSLADGVVTCTADSVPGSKLRKGHIVIAWCTFGFLLGLIYATDAGFNFFDVFDEYINFLLILVGFFECFALGWVAGLEEQIVQLGPKTVVAYMFTNFGSIITAIGVWFGAGSTWGGFVAWILFYAVGMFFTSYFLKELKDSQSSDDSNDAVKWTWKKLYWALMFQNINDYANKMRDVVGNIPFMWEILIKHIIPPALLVVFALGAADGQFGSYGGYVVWPYQVLGILSFCFAAIIILVGFAAPDLYWWTFQPQVDLDGASKSSLEDESNELAVDESISESEEKPDDEKQESPLFDAADGKAIGLKQPLLG